MANMSYARFRNTLEDLRDCEEHLFDDDLTPEEERARTRLIKICWDITNEFDDKEG